METSTTPTSKRGQSPKVMARIFVGGIVVTVKITALLINIFECKQEGHASFAPVVQIDETVVDPAVWGQNFPSQYEAFLRTAEFTESAHGGVMVPHDVEGDPRTEVPSSRLEEGPRLVDMWLGYPFEVNYRPARGHE